MTFSSDIWQPQLILICEYSPGNATGDSRQPAKLLYCYNYYMFRCSLRDNISQNPHVLIHISFTGAWNFQTAHPESVDVLAFRTRPRLVIRSLNCASYVVLRLKPAGVLLLLSSPLCTLPPDIGLSRLFEYSFKSFTHSAVNTRKLTFRFQQVASSSLMQYCTVRRLYYAFAIGEIDRWSI